MKKKAIKQKNDIQEIREWLYLAKGEITLRKMFERLDEDGFEIEIWEDAGVLEIILPCGESLDMEEKSLDEKDELLSQLLKKEDAEKVFMVTLGKGKQEEYQKIMKHIILHLGGIFCVDNESLNPIYRG